MLVWQAFQDTLSTKTYHDRFRCHVLHVHQWLVNHGYKCPPTYMSAPTMGILLTYQSLPPKERMSLGEAATWFYIIWTTNNTILDMFGELGCYIVVMLFPERSEYHLTYLALFLTNLAQLYWAQQQGLLPNEWTFGVILNVHKAPFGPRWQ